MLGQVKIIPGLAQLLKKQSKTKQDEKAKLISEAYHPAEDLPSCVIIDIDGTLALRGDRGPFDFDKSGSDDICYQARFVTNLIKRNNQLSVFIVSGREDKWRAITAKWLKDNEIEYNELFMRTTSDPRADFIIKKEIFNLKIRDKYKVFFVLEDRKQVKKMWVSLGIFVFDCNQKDEEY